MKSCTCDCHNYPLSDIESKLKALENRTTLTEKDLNHVPSFACIEGINKSITDLEESYQGLSAELRFLLKENEMRKNTIGCLDSVYNDSANNLEKLINILQERLSDLEKWTRKDEDRIYDRIKKIEETIKSMTELPNVYWTKYNKSPHKCPLCDGIGCGIIGEIKELPIKTDCCHGCEGKGIIWG